MNRAKRLTVAALSMAVVFLLAAPHAEAGRRKLNGPPAPMLMHPLDEARIKGESLEFRWSNEGGRPEYYDFRLYKGTQTYDAGLILKEKVPGDKTVFRVPADTFIEGETYTWSVRQIKVQRGPADYVIFKIVSKEK